MRGYYTSHSNRALCFWRVSITPKRRIGARRKRTRHTTHTVTPGVRRFTNGIFQETKVWVRKPGREGVDGRQNTTATAAGPASIRVKTVRRNVGQGWSAKR